MKSIVYILIIVFIGSMLLSAFPKSNSKPKQVVSIQCIDAHPDSQLFYESAFILKKRLADYTVQSVDIDLNTNQKTMEIAYTDKVDVSEIASLLTSQGKIEFYETFNSLDVLDLFEKEDTLFSLLYIPSESREMDSSSAILGFCKEQNKSQADAYLAKHYVSWKGQGIKFLWSESATNAGNYTLYMLKPEAAMDKSSIEKSEVEKQELRIEFNEGGKTRWLNLTQSNIGKSIALVLDDKVYFAPRVVGVISSGNCLISGDFSSQKINRLNSFINNDELPLAFVLKE